MVSQPALSKGSPILIVGAGVFGLSAALHLARRGYSNIKVIDKQQYEVSHYSYNLGCDGASADINKIIRAAYGAQRQYQDLALDAIAQWKEWNAEIQNGQTLPQGFTTSDRLFVNNGNLTMNSDASLTQFEMDTIQSMTKSGLGDHQFVLTNEEDVKRAKATEFESAINPFCRKDNYGLLDTIGGFVYADRACQFVLHKIRAMGVNLILGDPQGAYSALLHDEELKVIGVRTADGLTHLAVLTIMACGSWTPSLLPELDNLCESTAGSVCLFQLQKGTPLWDRFSPENLPTWTYKIRDGELGGLYGFARDPSGAVKIGYRGTKYTNPQKQADGLIRSVPITRWTIQPTRSLPQNAARHIQNFVKDFIPELLSCPMKTRLCWYTDSFDNHFVIDLVPGREGLMVATGGSGHGFKFLPNLGQYVVDRIEGRQSTFLSLWQWRTQQDGMKAYNSIMQGIESEVALQKQVLTMDDSLVVRQSHL